MESITLSQIAVLAGYIVAIGGVVKLVVTPFITAMNKNEKALKALEKSLDRVSFELESAKEDRRAIHGQLADHEQRLKLTEIDVATLKIKSK